MLAAKLTIYQVQHLAKLPQFLQQLTDVLQASLLVPADHQDVIHTDENEVHAGPQSVHKLLEGPIRRRWVEQRAFY